IWSFQGRDDEERQSANPTRHSTRPPQQLPVWIRQANQDVESHSMSRRVGSPMPRISLMERSPWKALYSSSAIGDATVWKYAPVERSGSYWTTTILFINSTTSVI